jgi:hypothetical protein
VDHVAEAVLALHDDEEPGDQVPHHLLGAEAQRGTQ